MTEEYMSQAELLSKYPISKNRFVRYYTYRNHNGLYKAIYRKRSKVFFRKDYFEKWLDENEIIKE